MQLHPNVAICSALSDKVPQVVSYYLRSAGGFLICKVHLMVPTPWMAGAHRAESTGLSTGPHTVGPDSARPYPGERGAPGAPSALDPFSGQRLKPARGMGRAGPSAGPGGATWPHVQPWELRAWGSGLSRTL